MTSGYNLQGIIRKDITNVLTQFERIGYYSENLSNWSTNGYKATRFEEVLGENGYSTGIVRTDHAQGSVQEGVQLVSAWKGEARQGFVLLLFACLDAAGRHG